MAMATRGSIEMLIFKLFSFLFGGLGPSGFGFSAPRDACHSLWLSVTGRPGRCVVRLTRPSAFVLAEALERGSRQSKW